MQLQVDPMIATVPAQHITMTGLHMSMQGWKKNQDLKKNQIFLI